MLQETLVWCKPVVVFLMVELVKISTLLGGRKGGKFILRDEDVVRVVH